MYRRGTLFLFNLFRNENTCLALEHAFLRVNLAPHESPETNSSGPIGASLGNPPSLGDSLVTRVYDISDIPELSDQYELLTSLGFR